MRKAQVQGWVVDLAMQWHRRWGSGPYRQGPHFDIEIADEARMEVASWSCLGLTRPLDGSERRTPLLARLAGLTGTSPWELLLQVGVVGLAAYGTEVATELVAQVGRAVGLVAPADEVGEPRLRQCIRQVLSCAVGATVLVAGTHLVARVSSAGPEEAAPQPRREATDRGQGPDQAVATNPLPGPGSRLGYATTQGHGPSRGAGRPWTEGQGGSGGRATRAESNRRRPGGPWRVPPRRAFR